MVYTRLRSADKKVIGQDGRRLAVDEIKLARLSDACDERPGTFGTAECLPAGTSNFSDIVALVRADRAPSNDAVNVAREVGVYPRHEQSQKRQKPGIRDKFVVPMHHKLVRNSQVMEGCHDIDAVGWEPKPAYRAVASWVCAGPLALSARLNCQSARRQRSRSDFRYWRPAIHLHQSLKRRLRSLSFCAGTKIMARSSPFCASNSCCACCTVI